MEQENQRRFKSSEYHTAQTSDNLEKLTPLLHHNSSYIRAAVASNDAITGDLLDISLHDNRRGVVMAALGNKNLTRTQFVEIFSKYMKLPYCTLIHPALAGHLLANISELQMLLRYNKWLITMEILNNHRGRDVQVFKKLIEPLLRLRNAEDGSNDQIVGRLAYKRTYGQYPYHKH